MNHAQARSLDSFLKMINKCSLVPDVSAALMNGFSGHVALREPFPNSSVGGGVKNRMGLEKLLPADTAEENVSPENNCQAASRCELRHSLTIY